MSILSQRIRQAMFLKGIRQVDIVQKTGLDRAQVSSYLNDKYRPNADSLGKLAKALEVSPEWLLGEEEIGLPVLATDPVLTLTKEEMDLLDNWRSADDTKKQIIKLTLGMAL